MRTLLVRGIALAVLVSAVWANGAAAATPPALVAGGVGTPLSNATNLSGAAAVAVSGNFAYEVSYWSGQLNVINVANPLAPTIVGSTTSTVAMTAATNVTVANGFAFVTAKNRNACVPGPPPTCTTPSNDDGSGNSLTIVNISNPAAPTVSGTLQDPNNLFGAYSVAVSGNFAYVASQGVLTGQPATPNTSTGSFTVLNISTGTPTFVSTIANSPIGSNPNALAHATGVAIRGNYAFVTAFNGSRLTTIDISNPNTPFIAHSLADPVRLLKANDVVINGNNAYVSDQTGSGSFQLAVVDISNPLAPSIVSTLSDSHLLGAYRIRAHGSFVYLSASNVASITAVDVSTPSAPRVAGSVTANASLANVIGLDVIGNGRYIIATAPHLSTELSPVYPLYPLQTGGPTATGTVSIIDLNPTPIAVTIAPASEPANPTTTTSASFTFAPSDSVSTLQCSLDGAALAPCTSATTANYSGLAVGTHTFTVQAADATGVTAQASYTWTIAAAPPGLVAPPTIAGSAVQGRTLTESHGSWTGNPTSYRYQWEACDSGGNACSAITGANSQTYAVTSSNVGHTIRVQESATNAIGTGGPATSASTAIVPQLTAAPVATSPPKITGTAKQGSTLSASTGTWSGTPAPGFSYVWQRCNAQGHSCTAIANQTQNTYRATVTDVGSTLDVVVTAKNSVGSATSTSSATKVVTWSSGSIASATLSHSKTTKLGLKFSLPSVGGGVLLQKITISLPKGLKFKGSHAALAKKLGLKSLAHKTLKFKVSLKHGVLTITLTKPSTGVTLTLPRGYVVKGKSAKLKSVRLKVSLSYAGKPVRSGSVSLRLG